MTKLQRGIVGLAMVCLGLGLAASLAFAQDDGTQVTAAIPCAYSPESMTTAFDRCQPVATNLSPIEELTPVQAASVPLHGFAEYGTNSCFIHPARLNNTQGNNPLIFPEIVEVAYVDVENKSMSLDCEFTIYYFHSERVHTLFGLSYATTCEFLAENSMRCTGKLSGGQVNTVIAQVAINPERTYPSQLQLTAPGLPWVHTWKFYGYGNFQPFVSR